MHKCTLCGKPIDPKKSVFTDTLVHPKYHKEESERSRQQDGAGPIRSRPPKYMLDPSEYSKYGY